MTRQKNVKRPLEVLNFDAGWRQCEKCGYDHGIHNEKPELYYIEDLNVLERVCRGCGYTWYERCKDGSPPKV